MTVPEFIYPKISDKIHPLILLVGLSTWATVLLLYGVLCVLHV